MREVQWSVLVLAAVAAVATAGACSANTLVVGQGGERVTGVEQLPDALAESDPSLVYDFLENAVYRPLGSILNPVRYIREKVEAYNVNSEDGVDDGPWFTNRNGRTPLSLETIARGANRGPGPDTDGSFTVIRVKLEGITPGYTIRDQTGREFLLKFDPVGYAELASAAEVISARLLYAAGYHVPETFVVEFDPDSLEAAPGLQIFDETIGHQVLCSDECVAGIIADRNRLPDGRLRALASRILPNAIGPFSFEGTRRDDPADSIPHEHRRELRGLYVMAAWLSHLDIKQHNSLDVVVEEDGHRFVRHYLIDFGATLGSGSVYPREPRAGVEYDLSYTQILARFVSLGAYTSLWERYKGGMEYPSIGFYSADLFEPGAWKPTRPNPAFHRKTVRDGYWGAKLVASFDEDQIRTAVREGRLSNPKAEESLIQAILARQQATLSYWYSRVTPLEYLEIAGSRDAPTLTFTDLAAGPGLAGGIRRYELDFSFPAGNVEFGQVLRIALDATGRGELPLPTAVVSELFWRDLAERPLKERIARLEITAVDEGRSTDRNSVRIYLLPDQHAGYRIVGRAY